ncbi:MAG: glycoside hydrolase family 97 protein [Muribaculaceae bacterium]|nr:glycoside hydrolase family 97 protein [Muribaculaceae bacterium]
MKRLTVIAFSIIGFVSIAAARNATVYSPSGDLKAMLTDNKDGEITLTIDGFDKTLLPTSVIGLDIQGKPQSKYIKSIKKGKTVSETVNSPFYRQSSFTVSYNPMTIRLSDGTAIELRAYNDGIAYRFVTNEKDSVIVNNEIAKFAFPADSHAWLSYSTNPEKPFAMAFQNFYDVTPLKDAKEIPAFLPATIDRGDNVKVTLLESDLESYPGMFLVANENGLNAKFPNYPSATDYYKWRRQQYVTEEEPFIAKTQGTRTYPWRIFAVSTNDTQMPVNNLVYALASPSRIADTSWIQPGKVAWDWWNDWGLAGVPFKPGINMETYKAYIDFASANNLRYVILDEGWYDGTKGDIMTPIEELDLQELIDYAAERNVSLVLWAVFNVLDEKLQEAFSTYSQMGIAGFKVDFLDRVDQTAVEMTYRIAQAAAENNLLLDLHGFYTPTGLNRTYPNILNFESVFGMEEMKWSPETVDMPLYEVTFPFIRLMAGPVDFTPGAMRNASRTNWKAVYNEPMSQGTRAHQLATYVIHDTPFTMLADAPTNYTDTVTLKFLSEVPVEIDSTLIVDGIIGEYIVTARRDPQGRWWIGGQTSWEPRDITLDFSFLPDGEYRGYILRDGPNADKIAHDYLKENIDVTSQTTLPIHMASGGGFVIKLQN